MMTLRLAWRSFVRHRRRSIISSAAIAFGLGLMLWFVGISTDSHKQMIDLGIHMGSGHIIVQGKGFQEAQTLDHVLVDPGPVIDAAKKLPGVKHVARRVLSGGLLTAGDRSAATILAGVEPQIEPNAAQPPTEAIAIPPRKRPRKRLAVSNKAWLRPAWVANCPINRNSGITDSS